MTFTKIWRMRRQCVVVICCLFVAIFVESYRLYASDSLRILTANEPPANYVDHAGNVVGFTVDVVKEIQKRIGNTSSIEVLPEKRLISMAETGNHIIIGISRTASREHHYRWIAKLITKPWVLYSYRESFVYIKNLVQAKELRVGVVHGDVREEYAKENGFKHIDAANSHFSNLRKLKEGRIDLAFFEPQGLAYECFVHNLNVLDYRPLLVPYVSEVYIVMPKDADLTTVSLWKKAIDAIKQDGTFFRIAKKWAGFLKQKYGVVSVATHESLIFTQ